MADISDIVLRIRVDIVNTKAIAGLVTTLNSASSAVRGVSAASKAAVTGNQRLEASWRRTGASSSLNVATNKRLNAGLINLNSTGMKSILSNREQYVVSQRLARGVATLTGHRIKEGAVSKTNTALNARLARGVQTLTAAQVKEGASSKTNTTLNQRLAQGVRTLTAATKTSSLATNEQYQTNARLARGVAIVTAQGDRRRASEARVAAAAAKTAAATEALYQRNKKLYGISTLVGQATGKVGSAFSKIVDPLSRVERKMDAVFRAGVHMQSMGRDLVGFAKKMIGFGKQMLGAWGDFEYTLNRAAAAAGIFSNTAPMYDELKKAIYGASRELKLFPAEEVAKATYFWQSTTGDTIETQDQLASTMKNVTAVMKLAAMTDSNYETTIKGVYSTLKQFGKTTKDTADVSALLYFATQKTALELPDLINSFKMTGAVMGQAEEPLTSMVAVLGAIGNAGFRGSQAGRALRQTYIKIVKPTAAAKTELNKLFKAQGGYNKVAFDSKGNFVGMEKYMMRMAKATQNMTYKQRAHLLATITTANELPVMTQMLRMAEQAVKSGDKSWTKFIVNQQIANDTFNDSWTMVSTSWKGVVGGLKQSVMPVLLQVGSIIADMLKPTLLELSDTIWGMGPAMEDMAKGLAETFRPFVTWIGEGIKKVAAWARANQKAVAAFAKYGIIATIISGVAGAFLLLAGTVTLLIANLAIVVLGALPLIAVFIAAGVVIAAFAVGVYRNVGGIKTSLERFGAAVQRAFKIFMGGSEDAEITASSLADSFMKLSDSVTGTVAKYLDKISGALERLTPGQAEAIKKIVKALILLKALNTGLGITIGVIKGLTGNIALMASAMSRAAPKIKGFLDAFSPAKIKTAATGMSNLAKSVADNMKTIGSALGSGAGKTAGAAEAGGKWAIAFVGGIAGAIGGAIVGALPAIGTALAGIVTAVVTAVGGWAVIIVAALVAAIIAAIGAAYATNFLGFKDFIDSIGRWFTEVAVPAVQGFVQGIIDAFGSVVTAVSTWVNDIITFIGGLPDAIATFLGDLVANVIAGLTEFASNWDYYLGYVLGVIIAFPIKVLIEIYNFGVNLGTTVVTFLTEVWNNFTTFFGNILTGLVNWFTTTIPYVIGRAAAFVIGIVDWIKQLPGKIADFFGQVLTNVTNWFATNIPIIALKAYNLMMGIVNWIKELPGKIAGFFGEVLTNITTWFATNIPIIVAKAGEIATGIINFFKNLPANIVIALKDLPKTVGDFFGAVAKAGSDLIKQVVKVGEAIVKGIWKGIEDMVTWFTSKITNFFSGIVDGVKKTLGIQSPSKVFAEIGTNMVEGVAQGIAKTDTAMTAMNAMIADLTSTTANAQLSLASTAGGNFNQNLTQDSTKTVELKVDVTSADGSVNSLDLNTLAGLITGSDMTRTLERMSTVD
jgi:TP901 family phage tail tape measure protein